MRRVLILILLCAGGIFANDPPTSVISDSLRLFPRKLRMATTIPTLRHIAITSSAGRRSRENLAPASGENRDCGRPLFSV